MGAQPTEPLRPAVHADDVCLPTTLARARLDWRSEAARIFELADKDHNGQLDMSELVDVRSSEEYAEGMMKEADTSKTGSLGEDEWLAHIKILGDKSERSAIKLLRLYERNIKESRASASRSPKVAQPTEPLRPAVHADDVCLPTTPARVRLDWRSEAVRIFGLADKDHNGQLDMSELLDLGRCRSVLGLDCVLFFFV